ncbi:hypothetical protein MKJ04_20820 [Pontibacter sp. E15-1]|uniref:hypothetical protein n=1 Tax=Pontibacter sp. E15-1 TaxID=2919918 RepID=UPI001F4FEFB8|nr:hypothetical protein [Pontibacter sp. E15-1]MCJ8167296.1 hypothetical protein [Pontibacter sp. E15-1]
MKKILYSAFALSALLFAATSCSEDRGTTTEVVDSNENENVDPSHIRGYGDAEPGGTAPAAPEAGQMYGFDRDAFSQQVNADMGLEGEVATQMVQVYYDRNRQLSEMEQRYQQAAANTDSKQRMDAERKRIDTDTDAKVKEILTPEQYKAYEQNRSKYNAPAAGNNASGTEMQ